MDHSWRFLKLLSLLSITLTGVSAQSREIDARRSKVTTQGCTVAQAQVVHTDYHHLKQRLLSLLSPTKGLPFYTQEAVDLVHISKIERLAKNPYIERHDVYYQFIHSRLVQGLQRIDQYVQKNNIVVQCEAKIEDCKGTTGFVYMDPTHTQALDNVIHFCPLYFETKNSLERVGDWGHELSHQVLQTKHEGLQLKDPRSYANITRDAYSYEQILASRNLEETLRQHIWAYFWFPNRR